MLSMCACVRAWILVVMVVCDACVFCTCPDVCFFFVPVCICVCMCVWRETEREKQKQRNRDKDIIGQEEL